MHGTGGALSEHPTAEAPRYVSARPPISVVVDGPRGSFPGWCTGWNVDRAHVRWTEAPGMAYMQVLAAAQVRREARAG